MTRTARVMLGVAAIMLLSVAGFAQVATGAPPFGSFGGGPFDTVNLGNLNVHFSVPVVHKAGRGMPFTYDLSYDSSIWTPVTSGSTTTWQPTFNWGWMAAWAGGSVAYITYKEILSYCYIDMHHNGDTYYIGNFVYHDPWGIGHAFSGYMSGNSCTNTYINTLPSTAGDGSGLILLNTSQIQTPNGAVLNPGINPSGTSIQATTVIDANGNKISSNTGGTFTDTLGTTALTVAGAPPSSTTFQYTGPSGPVTPPVTMSYVSKTVKTNFTCSGISQYGPTSNYLVDKITLADGSVYQFHYEDTPGFSGDTTGRIKSVTLPTGGTITYTYPGANNGISCTDGSTNKLTRMLSTGGTWTYTRALVSGNHWTTTVTTPPDPSVGDDTVIDFESSGNNFYETQRVSYQGTAPTTPLAATITCYNAPTGTTPTPSTCPAAAVSTPILRTTSFNYLPSTSGPEAETDTTYDIFKLVHDVYNYDFTAAAPPGTLLRHTATTYVGGMSNGIVDRPYQVKIYNGSGTLQAQTTYTYDESTPTATSGTPQHGCHHRIAGKCHHRGRAGD